MSRLLTEEEVAAKSQRNKASWYKPGKGFGEDIPGESIKKLQKAIDTLGAHKKKDVQLADKPLAVAVMDDSITLVLPWVPSVNHYWRRNKGAGMHISKEGKSFQADVLALCGNLKGIKGRVAVHVEASPPDRRKRDLDNVFKALCDALGHAGIIEDDCKIDDLRIVRCEPVAGGSVTVTVSAI